MPVDGAARLFAQKREVDQRARTLKRVRLHYIVDSGSATSNGRGANLQSFMDEASKRRSGVMLLVASVDHLAAAPEHVDLAIADLLAAGVTLLDASVLAGASVATHSCAPATPTIGSRRKPDATLRPRRGGMQVDHA